MLHADLVQDYRWLPYRMSPQTGQLHFVRAERTDHQAVTFLNDQLLSRGTGQRTARLSDLLPALADAAPGSESRFIFHTSFCCSTLLARALDVPGVSMGLKEPLVLNDLAAAAAAARRTDVVRPLLGPALQLLSRPFAPGEKVVIKPSNVVNPLIGEIIKQTETNAALFLSSPLDDFLRSVAKKGLFGRIWARRQSQHLARLPPAPIAFPDSERWEHSDLQVAALVWMQQRAQFARILAQLPPERGASLENHVLLGDPQAVLSAIARFFSLALSTDQIDHAVAGPAFQQDSKRHNRMHDPHQRRAEHQQLDGLLGDEIRMVVSWAGTVAEHFKLNLKLSHPLLDSSAP